MMRALVFFVMMALPAFGSETIVSGLSDNRVSITTNFTGSEILVFGAVKRDAPPPTDQPLGVIISAEGPRISHTVRQKTKVAGIWINTTTVELSSVPSFYAIASTQPLSEILTETEDLRHKISLDHVVHDVGISTSTGEPEAFLAALERIRTGGGHFQIRDGNIQFVEETLFRADITLPANLIEGSYKIRIFLVRDGKVVDRQERVVGVRKTGIERFLYNLAYEQPLVYGLLSLLMAIGAGWGASEAFRLLRR